MLHIGDCLDVLRSLPDCSVDSVVTDPPYGLEFMGKEWDAPWKASSVGRGVRVEAERASEMTERGKGHSTPGGPYLAARVDSVRVAGLPFQEWCELWATECLRVLKPGGHLLAFGGTRTWHRLACAVEDAGFEIRDGIAWLYGSGFPKSLDVSKAIDKRRTEDVEPVRVVCRAIRAAMDVRGFVSRHLVEHFDGCHPRLIDHWAARDTDSQPSLPTWEQWETLRGILPEIAAHDGEVWRLNGRKGAPGEAWEAREITGTVDEWADRVNYALTSRDGLRRDIPATPDAERWQGWGTALKPAFEPVVVARKPLVGTVAANVLTHGTGALNIDACRIDGDEDGSRNRPPSRLGSASTYAQDEWTRTAVVQRQDTTGKGRWPANVALDESQAAALDQQSGPLVAGGNKDNRGRKHGIFDGRPGERSDTFTSYQDHGLGASRYYYVAKAPKSERPRTDDGTAHPTVKPLTLMRWLVRLVTPPGGTVLEPFAGSGTTVEACILEGFDWIAIEREAEYVPLIEARIARATSRPPEPEPAPDLFSA